MPPTSLILDNIRSTLSQQPPEIRPTDRTKASVALILRGDPAEDVFFIVRAKHDMDPWSGDIGFPGGKIEEGESPSTTTIRETAEEVSIDLSKADRLGYLEPIRGAHLPVDVYCIAYALGHPQEPTLNHEVSRSFWHPVSKLIDENLHGDYPVQFGDNTLVRPGIKILPDDEPILWGITYRLLHQFFEALHIPFGVTDN